MENWKNIQGFEDYEISTEGRVRKGKRIGYSHVINKGYAIARLNRTAKDRGKSKLVHRLVATAFIPNPKNKAEVNHIDGNKLNNRVDNLEWVTHTENMRHAADVLGRFDLNGENNPNSKLSKKEVLGIKTLIQKGMTNAQCAKLFNISTSPVQKIRSGQHHFLCN